MLFNVRTQHVFQTFDDKSQNRSLAKLYNGKILQAHGKLKAANRQGAGVFFTVNEVQGRRSNANVTKIRALFCDLDTQDFNRTFDHLLEPSCIVESSPGKHHCYWLTNDFSLNDFSEYQKKLAAITGGDPVVCDLARVMRYPGFYHNKTDTPFKTHILKQTNRVYSAAALRGWIDYTYVEPTDTDTDKRGLTQRILDAKQGERNDTLNKVAFEAAGLAKGGLIDNTIFDDLREAAFKIGLEPGEINATLKSAYTKAKPIAPLDSDFGVINEADDFAQPDRLNLVKASSLRAESIRWVWKEWLAAGKMHILAGQAGTGKTTAALSFAATVSTGGYWPDETKAEQGDVIIWSGEDGIQDTLIPRLKRAGANLEHIHFISTVVKNGREGYFNPATDVKLLNQAVAQLDNVKLIIIDPIISAVSGDSNKANDVRNNLAPLYHLAERFNIALLGITHFNKSSNSNNVLDRVTGSQAFGALARVVFACVHNKDGSGSRSFIKVKANICSDQGGFIYNIDHSSAATCVLWGEYLSGDATDIVSHAEATTEEKFDADLAEQLITRILTEGPHTWTFILQSLKKNGLPIHLAKRARSRLNLVNDPQDTKVWSLPV